MMPITRQQIEVLLDTPDRNDYVISAYADMRVRDGFNRTVDVHMRNQARALGHALSAAKARKGIDANIEVIRHEVANTDPSAKGLAVFCGVQRGLLHSVPLDFPVDNELIIDEEPFVLPLLERWYGDPVYLVTVIDSHQAQIFEAHAGVPEPVREIEKSIDQDIQRDKPRFTYKKRFAQTRHERLHGIQDDQFLKDVAQELHTHWKTGRFTGLILLGHPSITAPFQRLLHKELNNGVIEAAPQAMTDRPEDVADDVTRAITRWRQEREQKLLAELEERWKRNHLVANGPTDVLDALQQGRAVQVVQGSRRDLAGARCPACNYRFGAPVQLCVYCQSPCQTVNAAQEILRMALRHRVPLHLFQRDQEPDPMARAGGVAALLRAEANWAPDAATAQASKGES